jgi:hypothetical protein
MFRRLLLKASIALVVFALILPAAALAETPPKPTPIPPGGLNPGPVPNTKIVSPVLAFNAPITPEEKEGADVTLSLSKPPTKPAPEPISNAGGLFLNKNACLNFNDAKLWQGNTWSRQYAGWGMQGLDDKNLYYAQNLTFDDETQIAHIRSVKIDGDKPFRGLLVSPSFNVPAGAEVVVAASYYIRLTANQHKRDDESVWASINVNPVLGTAVEDFGPTNGYLKNGAWHRFESRLTMGSQAGKVNVVLMGNNTFTHSSVAVYFDNVEIWVNGVPMATCLEAD